MARQRIKKGILEYSTNPAKNTEAQENIIEVRCKGQMKLSHKSIILGKRNSK